MSRLIVFREFKNVYRNICDDDILEICRDIPNIYDCGIGSMFRFFHRNNNEEKN